MLRTEIIAVCSGIHTKHIKGWTVWAERRNFNVNLDDT